MQFLARGVAIGDTASPGAGPAAHQDVKRHVADNQCPGCAESQFFQSQKDRFRIRLGFRHVIRPKHKRDFLVKTESHDKIHERMIRTGRSDCQHEAPSAKFRQSFRHIRKNLRSEQFLVLLEYVPVRLGALLSLPLRQRREHSLEAFTQRKSDCRRAGIFISHWQAKFLHRHLKRLDNGISGIAKGTVKVQNNKSVVHIAAKLTQIVEISSPRHRNGNSTIAAPKTKRTIIIPTY